MANIYTFPRRHGLNTLNHYEKLLFDLRKQELEMKNPLLKDWFEICNKIRSLERKIKELKNGIVG